MIIYESASFRVYLQAAFDQHSMFIHVSLTSLISIFRKTHQTYKQFYHMIVLTADKPGYNLIPQHTMKISSDCNRKVIVCLITHFTQVRLLVSLLQGRRGALTERKPSWISKNVSFFLRMHFCLIKIHALVSFRPKEG